MKTIDLHCDTASKLLYEGGSLAKNSFSIDIEKLKKASSSAQFFAHFIDLEGVKDPYLEFKRMYDNFMKEIQENSKDIVIVRNVKELKEANKLNKIGAFLSIEEGEVLQGKIERVKEVYNLGVRFLTLTWNYKNSIGFPNYSFTYKDRGLTELGKEFVCEMERVGIVPDCSHLSDRGFNDLVDICKKPFVATHSNARSITNHPRNLTDDMIVKLANKGGVMGLNFCSNFLGNSKIATIDEMIAHIKYIRNVGGVDMVALGTDFDGIENEVEIKNIGEINKLNDRLIKEGFKSSEIEKLFSKNAMRILRECL